MTRRLLSLVLAPILALLLSGAWAQTYGGTLNVAVSEPVPSLDMQRAITPGIVNVLINVYEPLVTKDFGGKITIEHVLPQALKDAYWRERFTDDEHRLWLHRLGNLALLAGIKNYKAQYFPFDRKKKIYAERNNRVSFDTTKPILSADHWTKDLLTARQADLVDRAQRNFEE